MTTVEQTRTTRAEAPEIMPFDGWETTPIPVGYGAPETLFRFPAPDDPAPPTARLLAMSSYYAMLGVTGVGVGFWGLVTVLHGAAFWYMPVLSLLGFLSVAAAVASFLSIHQRLLPWALLLASSAPMTGAAMLAVLY